MIKNLALTAEAERFIHYIADIRICRAYLDALEAGCETQIHHVANGQANPELADFIKQTSVRLHAKATAPAGSMRRRPGVKETS